MPTADSMLVLVIRQRHHVEGAHRALPPMGGPVLTPFIVVPIVVLVVPVLAKEMQPLVRVQVPGGRGFFF